MVGVEEVEAVSIGATAGEVAATFLGGSLRKATPPSRSSCFKSECTRDSEETNVSGF